jgi:hypothetical protein
MVRDFRLIAINYLRGWFILDFAGRWEPPLSPLAPAQAHAPLSGIPSRSRRRSCSSSCCWSCCCGGGSIYRSSGGSSHALPTPALHSHPCRAAASPSTRSSPRPSRGRPTSCRPCAACACSSWCALAHRPGFADTFVWSHPGRLFGRIPAVCLAASRPFVWSHPGVADELFAWGWGCTSSHLVRPRALRMRAGARLLSTSRPRSLPPLLPPPAAAAPGIRLSWQAIVETGTGYHSGGRNRIRASRGQGDGRWRRGAPGEGCRSAAAAAAMAAAVAG